MNRKVVLVSYAVIAVSLGILMSLNRFFYSGFYYTTGIPTDTFLGQTIQVLAIGGLVMGPYFGLAGLIAKDRTVWFEANRLVHQHISVPFIMGSALFYGTGTISILAAVIPAYIVFVSISTLMTVMATKTASTDRPQKAEV